MFGGRTRSKNKLLHAFGFYSGQAWRLGIVALLYIGANLYDKVYFKISSIRAHNLDTEIKEKKNFSLVATFWTKQRNSLYAVDFVSN